MMGLFRTLFVGDGLPPKEEWRTADDCPGWVAHEVRDHDRTGCPGTSYEHGKWGGLVCTTCGR